MLTFQYFGSADTKVHRVIPIVIATTDKCLYNGYLFPNIIIPSIKLAINDPYTKCKNKKSISTIYQNKNL